MPRCRSPRTRVKATAAAVTGRGEERTIRTFQDCDHRTPLSGHVAGQGAGGAICGRGHGCSRRPAHRDPLPPFGRSRQHGSALDITSGGRLELGIGLRRASQRPLRPLPRSRARPSRKSVVQPRHVWRGAPRHVPGGDAVFNLGDGVPLSSTRSVCRRRRRRGGLLSSGSCR
jgi:hypothetical protein